MRSSAFVLVGLAALPALGLARPVRNSFVNRRVADARGLVAHVQSDPEVADRYERHFAMDRGTLLAYLGGLHRGALAQPGYFTIYSVPDDGHLKMHVGRLPKGEPMFLDRNGKPILVVKCGNPVVLGPRRARRGNPVALDVPRDEGATKALLAEDIVPAASDLVALTPHEAAVPVVEIPTSTESAPIEAAPMAIGATTVAASGGSGWASVLMGLGGLSIATSSVGGHGGSTQPVPEPATLVVLAAGAGVLARRRKR